MKTTKTNGKKAKTTRKTPQPTAKGKLGAVLGFSVISVIRAMGREGWDFEQATAALKKAKIPAKEHTVRMALKRGRDGEKAIAPVTAKQLASLRATRSKNSR